jgi:plastocyanin
MTAGPRLAALAATALIALGAVACSDTPGEPPSDPDTVALQGTDFNPEQLTVPTGTTVRWIWEQEMDHNVVGEGFESPVQSQGDFTHTFEEAGTYDYRCTLHPGMTGTVTVE